ncbi:MAG: 2-C-methyl-D-erythritol 4-phosphate cytidylyltransferase [Deltaproteobacteria bacterium]|nr:2-C-methyl-D-erythritol 4-phosphate cytidylyltransferase [Deltaproteobacteria bacterium]
MRVAALIPAAGRGRRMAEDVPKAFLPMGGTPLLAQTLQQFEVCSEVGEVVVLAPPGNGIQLAEELVKRFGFQKVSRIVPGGTERQDSVYAGLKALVSHPDIVLIHDGVRPFITPDLIGRVVSETRVSKAVVAAIPVRDTMKEIGKDGTVLKTLNRDCLWEIQTPQGFLYSLLLQAYEKAYQDQFYGTDDAALVERLGIGVKVVQGSRFNLKITTPEDLVLGEALLMMKRG